MFNTIGLVRAKFGAPLQTTIYQILMHAPNIGNIIWCKTQSHIGSDLNLAIFRMCNEIRLFSTTRTTMCLKPPAETLLWRILADLGGPGRILEGPGRCWRSLEDLKRPLRTLEYFGGLWRTMKHRGGERPLQFFGGAWRTFRYS